MQFMKQIKYRVEYIAFISVALVARALPLETSSAWFGAIWRLFAPLSRRHERAIANLALAFPEKSREDRDRVARDMWEMLGRIFAEFFHLDEIYNSDRIDASRVLAGMAEGAGYAQSIVCACHQGNWEIAALAPARMGVKVGGIYQRITNPLVDQAARAMRSRYYPGGLSAKGPRAGAQALRAVRQGGCLALLADLRDNAGLKVPFFGHLAPSSPFPAHAARLLNVPLYALFIERAPGVRFRISIERIEVPRSTDRDADVLAATASLQAAFERSIRLHPEQWMWAHRRWG